MAYKPLCLTIILLSMNAIADNQIDCQNPRNNYEYKKCLSLEAKEAEQTFDRYVREVRAIHFGEMSNVFKATFDKRVENLHQYVESKCTAVYEYSSPFTKAGSDYSRCKIDTYQSETLDLWYDFLERQITDLEKPSHDRG